jgi:N-acetylneuraminate synthase
MQIEGCPHCGAGLNEFGIYKGSSIYCTNCKKEWVTKVDGVKIGKKNIGTGFPCFLVGEIGINHNGDVSIAKHLIDIAAGAGWDAVKFQKRTIDVVYTKEELAKPRESVFGSTNGDLKRGLEFGLKEYVEIDNYCRKKDIIWYASGWDEASIDFLADFDIPCFKVASASLTDDFLLRHVRSKGKPVILSTGMSTQGQVDHAVFDVLGTKDLVLLHTCSTYPSATSDLNLNVIKTLKEGFKIPVGYSGHETGLPSSSAAIALGVCMIERHITLDRAMWGSDQAASLGPSGILQLARDVRLVEEALGDGVKRIMESEVPIMKKLRRK